MAIPFDLLALILGLFVWTTPSLSSGVFVGRDVALVMPMLVSNR
jgi:hypothetical protein